MTNPETISKAKDNSFKVIFDDPELFSAFIKDFIDIDILKDIKPSDIKDVSERYLPLHTENKDSDTVKRIELSDDTSLFIITILEHESKVNYRMPFKMLQYISLVLDKYEKEVNKKKKGTSFKKNFKYPAILPIVYYDGKSRWTAEKNFLNRTDLSDIFEKYIPKFEYELIDLNTYSYDDIMKFGDTISFMLLLDKVSGNDDFLALKQIIAKYYNEIDLNIPDHLRTMISRVARVMLTNVNVPQDEIDEITDKIDERSTVEMFESFSKYDVQETRKIARDEGHDDKVIMAGTKKSLAEIKTIRTKLKMKSNQQ
ncbi:MAG: Rpn family recombination-promoting nuclease/putative transposase [Clostridiales Family XIII bacterium]|jgi:hypothetical protein|nr:Rpn family recombination-promoting nuclease/putative transposase [Clostridiales Family XIII bacterium]